MQVRDPNLTYTNLTSLAHASLIARAHDLYEGTVVKIDKVERALHLIQVKQFGTEDRKPKDQMIPARDDVIEMIVFKIELVANFHIIPDEEL